MGSHHFTSKIIQWYQVNARELPWRNTQDPYLIWLSEIILQQTRVNQGLPYFQKITEAFPTVEALAAVNETDFLRYWQGLGYYSRARNLLKTARIVHQNNNQFPDNFSELFQLPGIGEYTAAAIASFAFGETVPVVDGNVFRILSRYFGIEKDISLSSTKKYFFDLSKELIDKKNPAIYNQAIMEFGSLQCWVKPQCEVCPLQDSCWAFANNAIQQLPVKTKKLQIKNRYFHYFFIEFEGKIFFQERKNKDVWQGLWEPYLIESDSEEFPVDQLSASDFKNIQILDFKKVHQLSHQKIFANAYFCQIFDKNWIKNSAQNRWLNAGEIDLIPKSTLVENLITHNHLERLLTYNN